MKHNRKTKFIAILLINTLLCQLVFPNVALALTSGPTQPEVQGFEPVGTTDMVDMFSGSFVYNIPLLDVEGYPVNISYHGGVSMEQEASWVGLGWNINPGVISRTVRGVPDDFNGDTIHKDFNIKAEKTIRVGVGVGLELGGVGDPVPHHLITGGGNFNANINISNYRGVSCDLAFGGGINVFHCVSAGVNMGVGSQTGASVDYTASLSLSTSLTMSKGSDEADARGGLNVGVGGGYSSRGGVKDLNLSVSTSIQSSCKQEVANTNSSGSISQGSHYKSSQSGSVRLFSGGGAIPIGVKNYLPVITNSSTMNTIYGRIKVGGEFWSLYGYGNVSAMYSNLTFENDASRKSYGYMYLQNSGINSADILDFTRDKDGMFNKNMGYLPVPSMTYDIYSVSGQGTGGMFRPFRNDFGSVYDPFTTSTSTTNSGEGEFGIGAVFEAGLDYTNSSTEISSGPWRSYQRSGTTNGFTSKTQGSTYENVYFKQGGELTAIDPAYLGILGSVAPITPDKAMSLPQIKPNSNNKRDARGNLIYYRTAAYFAGPMPPPTVDTGTGIPPSSSPIGGGTLAAALLAAAKKKDNGILSYSDPTFSTYSNPSVDTIKHVGTGHFQRKRDQIAEFVQVQKNGNKYVYGIPALNNVQREVTFNATGNPVDVARGLVAFSGADATNGNTKGRDNYYSSTVTPSYAHSYLLTSVLSNDYVDVTGNGVSDDDLGTFTKFNYTRTDSDYRWIAPYSRNVDSAQFSPGFWSDKMDDRGSFVCGSREQWNLHSIETKNFIAEFYTSVREDGQGIGSAILNNGESALFNHPKPSGHSYSYKLDSIKLYNKHDRFVNREKAIPVKSVFFVYSYDLCYGVPNTSTGGTSGKLSLLKIYFSYGNSQKSMISPYTFGYAYSYAYDVAAKDRWGNYKPNNPAFTNYEYPYVNQNDPSNDNYASAWSLVRINLPSGGVIKADYESNDYAFVQDKTVNEMFMVAGIGKSPDFVPSSQLYTDKNSPCLYTYFKRRIASESPGLSFAKNYLGLNFRFDSANCIYFNFNVQLTNATNTNEQIKGYAKIRECGICNNNADYGYIKFQDVSATGGDGILNPITLIALNVGRYNLPQIVFPGQNPDESNMHNILAGLKGAFNELFATGRNPIISFIKRSGGKSVNLTKSYIRLQSVGLAKKGGGQRVKQLSFDDRWDELAGGNESAASYGKKYSYKVFDSTYGREISSGVANYEPLIGGDENPFRQPIKDYTAQAGSHFPPNDAVDLYQESPIGESLFPAGQVGYSKVTVTSIHQEEGRSSKGLDEYDFYTSKDFPVQVIATAINAQSTNHYDFFSQQNLLTATQGYTLVFNDMHGKPKKVEHGVYNTDNGAYRPISYQIFNYKQSGNKLDNLVSCLSYNGSNMSISTQQLGIEADITFDSRQKNELTTNSTFNANLNYFGIPPAALPVFYAFGWGNDVQNEFQSAVVTKVIQQYGILDNIESYNEGAKTIMRNEIYDPLTGQPVVTSLNNEFEDKEYTTNIPASWAYSGMSGSYENIGYTASGTIKIDANNIGALVGMNTTPLTAGDQLDVYYDDAVGHRLNTTLWVMGKIPSYSSSGAMLPVSDINVLPRYPYGTYGWGPGVVLNNVSIEVVSSGHKNMLNENVESYSSMNFPISGGILTNNLTRVIDLKAKTFADSNTRIVKRYLAHSDTLNPYVIGERGEWRLLSEYSYLTSRDNSGTSRSSGLFDANGLFASASGFTYPAYLASPYKFIAPFYTDPKWHAMRTITKWSPYGKEVENLDAIGNYSTALFGYNEDLPVAVASNAKQGEILSLGFEEYYLLKARPDTMTFKYYGFTSGYLANIPGATGSLYQMTAPLTMGTVAGTGTPLPANDSSLRIGHTGNNSCIGYGNALVFPIPVKIPYYSGVVNKFNSYFSSSPTTGYQFTAANEYLDFAVEKSKEYILNCWIMPSKVQPAATNYIFPFPMKVQEFDATGALTNTFLAAKKTNIIDGWEQWEVHFKLSATATNAQAIMSAYCYVDDVRIFPANSNMKTFVYGPVNTNTGSINEKLVSTLDENNFATIYEYDQEGNLIRVKKETANGIMTVSESRSGNPKK